MTRPTLERARQMARGATTVDEAVDALYEARAAAEADAEEVRTMLTEEQIRAYARRGIRADTVSKGGAVKMAMTRLKEAFDRSPPDGANASSFREPVDNLMAALVAFSAALELAANARKELGDDQ